MAKFDPKNPPIFFDATGRRWFFTKIITFLILLNIGLFGILSFGYYSNRGDLVDLNNIIGRVSNSFNIPFIQAKASTLTTQTNNKIKEVDSRGNFYTVINSNQSGNYDNIRDKVQYIDKIICDCYQITTKDKEVNFKDNSTRANNYDVNEAINYAQTYKPTIVVSKLITLTTETITNSDSLLKSLGNLPDKNQELIIDVDTNQIKVDSKLIDLLKLLKSQYNLSLFIGSNLATPEYLELNQVTNSFYVQLLKYSAKNGFDNTYSTKNLKSLIQAKDNVNFSLNLPTYTSFGNSSAKINQLIIKNQDKTINFETNQVPYLQIQDEKVYFGNEFYYNNLLNDLKSQVPAIQFASLGFDSLVEIPTQSFGLLSDGKSILEIAQNYSFSDKVDLIGNQNLAIFDLINKATTGTINLEQDQSGQIKKATVTKSPTQSQVKISGSTDSKISLSFDDGPSPDWTPKLLDKLRTYPLTPLAII